MPQLGTLLVVSGPSGSGKTTLCRRAADNGLCQYSISCTTRAPREGEANGRDYHFLTMEEFEQKITNGEFLEHAQVHGNRYGTLKKDIINLVQQGVNVIMDIDVQGAAQVRGNTDPLIRETYADVYIRVNAVELENRLRLRSTDPENIIRLRLENAFEENKQARLYDYIIESSDRESDYARFSALITALGLRKSLLL